MANTHTLPTNGAVIRALRQALGLTRDEVAAYAQIADSHLGNIELGRRAGSVPVLRLIAERLHVPLDAVVRCGLPKGFAQMADRLAFERLPDEVPEEVPA